MSSSIVSAERLTKRYADKQVLAAVTLGIRERDRVGVIGLNGSGKSTLLRLVAGVEAPDDGRVVPRSGTRVRYLPQVPAVDPATPPLEQAVPAADDAVLLHSVDERRARARGVLHHLGVGGIDQPVGVRSGGERKRIALARALLDPADLLILDEPTNHLDVDAVQWLEDELLSRSHALLFVTHDRYLLDSVATRIVELHDGRLHTHEGGYESYLQARAQRVEQLAAGERRRQNRLRTELEWLRRRPAARTTKAKHRVAEALTLVEDDPPPPPGEVVIDLPARRIGSKVVNLHNVGKRYDDDWVLRGVDYKLAPGDRIGVVGPNGSGKTTLLRLIAGRAEPDEGSIRTGETVAIGWFGQELPAAPPRQRVLEAVRDVVREANTTEGVRLSAAQLLERFLFTGGAQKAYVTELSGGERRRLELLLVLATAPNLVLLDEPTNDLDLDTLTALEEHLDAWSGTLVVASHDRYFLDRVCRDILSVEPDGSVRHHPGGWSAYRRRQLARRAQQRDDAGGREGTKPERRRSGRGSGRKLSYNEVRELRQLERLVPELEERKEVLTAALQDAADDYERSAALSSELADVLRELERVEGRWLELAVTSEET